MNVLWPNVISQCLHKVNHSQPLLFAIETYPLSLAQPYRQSTAHLKELLTKALLHFVEKQGRGLCNQQGLAVVPMPPPAVIIDGVGNQVGGPQYEIDRLRLGVRQLASKHDYVEQDAAFLKSQEVQDKVVPKTPPRAALPANVLRDFTKILSQLFRSKAENVLPMAAVAGLAIEFPGWENHIQDLSKLNKVMVADDLVFLV